TDLESKAQQLGAVNLGLSVELTGHGSPETLDSGELRRLLESEYPNLLAKFSGLTMVFSARGRTVVVPGEPAPATCNPLPPWVGGSFSGMVALGNQLFLHSVVQVPGWRDARLCLTVPVDENLLADVGTDIGHFRLFILEEVSRRPASGRVYVIGEHMYVTVGRIEPRGRPQAPASNVFDPVLSWASKFNVVQWEEDSPQRQELPVFLRVETRPSLLYRRIFAPLGEVAQAFLAVLLVIGLVFLLLQVVSLVTGVRLTRTITAAINDLDRATQRVRAGDFSVRVPHRRDDQLGALGDSFNRMAASIQRLIAESKERQRLEQELEIARQVQEQLFPREVPRLETLELVGRCRPARVVSGDYYDYGLAAPGKLVFTIGDISGKGISAALLMATIQSILRSHGYASRLTGQLGQLSPAELVSRVNRQLCATTSVEKFSTLFIGLYDDSTRRLTYTNAGHLPPAVLGPRRTQRLDAGGTVVGVFHDASYEQASLELHPGDWLVAYTDGLTEVENSYEEEYGNERLLAFLERAADHTSPEGLAEAVLAE
ncbi:MAG: PP2C family protein-serine/threonine phosphatase, partial [Terriglobia bacterium]